MREWKDINERLVREHGEEFRFGYVIYVYGGRKGAYEAGVEQRTFELLNLWESGVIGN
jgi:hypothetical protein